MQFGIGLAPFDRWASWEQSAAAVVEADRLGFDYVARPDHVIVPEGPQQPRSGVMFPDVIALSAFLAGRTSTIRFVLAALLVPLVLAKQMATVDQLCGGRLAVVVGTGWLVPELEAFGVEPADRAARTDEYLRIMKQCWTAARPSYEGTCVSFRPSAVEPKYVQRPHVPLWIGGNGPRPERRVVGLGDGWAPLTGTFDERAATIRSLRERAEAAGRDAARLSFIGSITVGTLDDESRRLFRGHHVTEKDLVDEAARRVEWADAAHAEIDRADAAGFTHLGVTLGWETPEELRDRMEWFATEVMRRRR